MNNTIKSLLAGLVGGLLALFIFNWTYTYDTETPLGSDAPSVIDDKIREVKDAVQERSNVDHYWPLTGTEVSDADAGEHRWVQYQGPNSVTTVAANKGVTFIKDANSIAELHWTDENENELQITSEGALYGNSLKASSVLTAAIADANVTLAKMADESIDSDQYVDGSIDTAHIADANITTDKIADANITTAKIDSILGAYAADDDDTAAMTTAHAYLANQDGQVTAIGTLGPSSDTLSTLTGYVDTDSNPASGGTIMDKVGHAGAYNVDNDINSIKFLVASGEYFEITVTNYDAVTILWRPFGTLIKCTDQD